MRPQQGERLLTIVLALGIGTAWEGSPPDFLPLSEFARRRGALEFRSWPAEILQEFEAGWIQSPSVFKTGFVPALTRAIARGHTVVFNLAAVTREARMTCWEVQQFHDPKNAAWLVYTDFYENDRLLAADQAADRRKEILSA